MSKVVSMRIRDEQAERLQRVARRFGRTASETSALLVEEGLRQAEFGHIEFRNSAVGRQAYVRGTSLAVWEVVWVARDFDMDASRTAEHLRWPEYRVSAALNYAAAFPKEIAEAIEDNDSYTFEKLKQMLPQIELFTASDAD